MFSVLKSGISQTDVEAGLVKMSRFPSLLSLCPKALSLSEIFYTVYQQLFLTNSDVRLFAKGSYVFITFDPINHRIAVD